jgi:flagellar protein FlaG
MKDGAVQGISPQIHSVAQAQERGTSTPVMGERAQPAKTDQLAENNMRSEERARVSQAAIEDTVRKINAVLDTLSVQAEFQVHEDIDVIQVRVVDRNTGELVREIPAEDVINRLRKFKELTGLLFDLQV